MLLYEGAPFELFRKKNRWGIVWCHVCSEMREYEPLTELLHVRGGGKYVLPLCCNRVEKHAGEGSDAAGRRPA
jgi:hypothetical protein